jgi:ketosteroid isomerase-like protein
VRVLQSILIAPTRLVLASLLTLIACGPETPDDDDAASALDTTAMAAAIRARADGFAAAVVGGNVDSVAGYVTTDVVLLEPGIDVKGRDALRTLLGDLWKVYKITSFTMTPETRTYSADVVTEFGRYRETYTDSTAKELACDCVYSMIWRKEPDGVWRQARIHAGQPIKQ